MGDQFNPFAPSDTSLPPASSVAPVDPLSRIPESTWERLSRERLKIPTDVPPPPGVEPETWSENQVEVYTPGEDGEPGSTEFVPKDRLARQIAESGMPRWEADRQDVVDLLHMLTDQPREELYGNLEGILEHMAGRPVPIEEAKTTIGQWWQNGVLTRQANGLKQQFHDQVLAGDPEAAETFERLENIMGHVDSNQVTVGNWFADGAVKPFLEMMPRLIDPIFQGATLNLATQSAIVGTAALLGAPVTGGASLMGLPYALALSQSVGIGAGTVQSTTEWAHQIQADQFYELYTMKDPETGQRMDPHIMAAVLWPFAGISALVESAQIATLLPRGSGLAMKGLTDQFITKLVANGVIRNWAIEGVARYGATVGTEAFEELTQGVIDGTARLLATEVQNQAHGTDFDKDTFQDIVRTSLNEFVQSIGPVSIMALPGGMVDTISNRPRATQAARQTPQAELPEKPTIGVDQNEEGKFEVWVGTTMVAETADEAEANRHAEIARAQIDEAWGQVEASQQEAPAQEAQAPPVARTETGRIQTEVESVGTTDDGVTLMMKAGDPETGERTGYVTFDEEPSRVYIRDVVTEGDADVRAELVMEVMARNPGKEIVWDVVEDLDTPAAESNVELRQQLIAQNPRGDEFGLQYFEQQEQVQPTLTSEIFIRKYSEAFNMSHQETEQMSGLVDAIVTARNEWTGEGLTPDQFLRKLVEPEVVAEEAPQQQLASAGAVAGVGFQAGDQTVSPLKVGEFKGQVRAVFTALENADFHHGVHEFFHAVERLALVPQQVKLMEEAVGKPRDQWTERDLETLADRFEDYLGTGRAPTPQLRTLFQQIADLLWEIVSFLKERFAGPPTEEQIAAAREARLSPEFEAAYDALFTTQRRAEQQEAPQQRSVEPVTEQVVDEIVQPEAQQPDPAPVTMAFDPVENPPVNVPLADISLSEDVPNFKEGADAKGLVTNLKGEEYVTTPGYPILLWERLSGRLEVITGRHRLDLARRLGMEQIPAQIQREADGFTVEMAMTVDAESNIREEKGTVRDYANYFRFTDTTEKQASRRGLLDSDKGRKGFSIGRYATDNLYSAYRNGRIRDTKAAAIASAAIGNEALQAEGIKRAADLAPDELINYLNILNNATPENQVEQADLFGRDESFMKDAAALAKEAVKVQKELKTEYNALKSAVRLGKDAQRKVIEQYGFEAGDSRAMKGRMYELEQEIESWTDWFLDSEKHAQLRNRLGDSNTLFHPDYSGLHTAPGRDGAPAFDLTVNVYPDDVYGFNAVQYYGTGEAALDWQSIAILHDLRGRPDAKVTIYRAVPDDLTTTDKIAKLEKQKAHIMKRGELPSNVETQLGRSAYYDQISTELDRLASLSPDTQAPVKVNAGDWVTINRTYAKQHGESALRGNYKIIQKTVRARDIYTNGDSIHEWGYFPAGNMLHHRAIEGPALLAKKAKKIFGTTEDPNEAGYILPNGEMLDFSGKSHGRTIGGDRGLDHRAIWQEGAEQLGLTAKDPTKGMYEWMFKSSSVRIKGFGNAEAVGIPTTSQLRVLVKALNEADGEVFVVLMNRKGNTETHWRGMRATVSGLQKWFVDQSRNKARVSRLLHAAPDPWILKSVEILRAKMQGPMPGTNIKAMLTKAGVKPDEMKWLNLDEYLETSEKRTLDDVLQFIEQNDVKVEDKVLGARTGDLKRLDPIIGGQYHRITERMLEVDREFRHQPMPVPESRQAHYDSLRTEYEELSHQRLTLIGETATRTAPKYETYALAGGKEGTYGELLLTLPNLTRDQFDPAKVELSRSSHSQTQGTINIYYAGQHVAEYGNDAVLQPDGSYRKQSDEYWMDTARELFERGDRYNRHDPLSGAYISSHWSEPNVVAHSRYKLHDSADGPVLLIEELQSDWGQDLRASGPLREVSKPESARVLLQDLFGPELPADVSLSEMQAGVLALRHHNEVARLIVSLLPVDVVNQLGGQEAATEKFSSKAPMIGQSFPVDARASGALGIVDAAGQAFTLLRAKLSRAFQAGIDADLLPALRTSDLSGRELIGLLAPELLYSVKLDDLSLRSEGAKPGAEAARSRESLSAPDTEFLNARIAALPRAKPDSQEAAELDTKRTPTSIAEALDWHNDLRRAKGLTSVAYTPGPSQSMPFKKTWHELAFRRMLRFATEAGVKRIAWTTGQQQADRYNLSNFIDRVHISKSSDGWVLRADKGPTPVLTEEAATPDAFVPFVGKELVRKAVDEIGDAPVGAASYEGLEMNVGGEGMKAFYDKILVNYANKYGKKWGAKVESVEIDTLSEPFANPEIQEGDVEGWVIQVDVGDTRDFVQRDFNTREEAQDYIDLMTRKQKSTVHSLPITPEMEAAVSQGQYLFHQADNWQGQFIYGTSIDKDVYQTYVDHAKQFDTLEQFQGMMQGIYADIDVKAAEITEANKFLAEVFEKAQQQRVREGQTEGLASNRIKAPDLPEFSQYSRQDKFTAARDIVDKDIARLIESGEVTKADLDRFVLEAESAHDEAQRAAELAEAEDLARRRELDSGPQAILDLGDDIDRSIDALAAMAADSPRRVQAEARLKDLYRRFRRALFEDLKTAEDLVDEAVWERAIILRETLTEPDLMGRFGEAGEEAVQLGRDLQAAIDDQKLAGAMEERTEKHKESRARIYAKKRVDIKRAREKVRETYKAREATRLMRQARIKLMKSIMRPPGKGVEYRGYAETIRQVQDALDPLAPQDRADYQKLHSRKFLNEHPDAEIYMTEDWLDNIYAQAHPDYTIADLEKINDVIQRLREDGRALRARVIESERAFRDEQRWRLKNAVLRGEEPRRPVGRPESTPSWLAMLGETWKPDRIAYLLDGLEKNGPFDHWLQDEVNTAWADYKEATRARQDKIFRKMRDLKLTMDPLDPRRAAKGFTWIGRKLELGGFTEENGRIPTANDAMYWRIGMQNERSRAAILNGTLIPEEIVLSGIAQLTEEEAALADAIAKDFEDRFIDLREAFIDVFNMDLPGEDHYVPLRRLEISYERRSEEVASELTGRNGLRKQFISRHPTYQRIDIADEHQKPIRTDLVGLWMENVKITEGFIHQDRTIKRLHSILESDEVRAAVQQKYGSKMNRWISTYINDLAQEDAYQAQSGLDKASRIMRTNAAISYLAFNLTPMLVQTTGVINYMADAGPGRIAGAAAQMLGGHLFEFVDARTEVGRSRQINQEIEDLKRLNLKLYQNVVKKIGVAGMKMYMLIDKATIYVGWKAVYDANYKKLGEEGAIRAADKATVRTQPSARVQDMAAMYRRGEILKWFTMFTSELNVIWNRLTFDIPVAIKKGHLGYAAMDFAAIALVGLGVAVARGALYKDDEEEKRAAIVEGVVAQIVESTPIVGRDIGALVSGRYLNSGVTLVPAAKYLARTGIYATQSEWEKAAGQAARGLALSVGAPMTGVSKAMNAIREQDAAELLGWDR